MNKTRIILVLIPLFVVTLLFSPLLSAFADEMAQQDDSPVALCAEGVQLFFDGQAAEALPLLEAGFAGREEATFSNLDDEGRCAFALGSLRDDIGDRSGALDAYEVALDIFQASGNRQFEASTLNNIGLVYDHQGRFDLALESYQQALEIARQAGDRAEEGTTLNNIGLTYRNQGRFDLALESYQQALEIKREVGDRATEGTTLHNIGTVYHDQGRFDLALETYQQALEIRRDANVGDRAGEGATLNSIGTVYHDQGGFDLALETYQQALEIRREVGDRPGESVTLNNIGSVYDDQGRFDLALDTYQQALEIKREVGDRLGEGVTLNNIGTVYNKQGRFELALQSYEQALEIRREVGQRVGEAITLNNIAAIYTKQGRFDLALQSYQQALGIAREVGSPIGEGVTLNNIGDVYARQRRFDLALESYQQALEILRLVGYRVGEGATLNNIGTAYNKQGDFELALQNYQQALEIARSAGERTREGTTLNNIANVYNEQGRFELALENYQQALEIAREVGDRGGEGATLNNIGSVYGKQERFDLALESHQQGLAIVREVGDRAGEGATLNNLGFIYQQQGQLDKALTHYELAMDIFEELRAEAGSEEGRASFIAQHAEVYNRAIELYQQQSQDEAAFLTSERGRARSFLDSLATGYVQLSDNEAQELLDQEQEAYAARLAAQDALARASALDPPSPELVADLEEQLAEAEQAHSVALDAIEARGGQLADLVPGRTKQVSLSEIQANLPENTTLVSYYIVGDDETLAFILTPDKLKVVPLGVGEQELTEQITAFSFSFANPFLNELDAHQSEELLQLYQWLITPLKPHLNTPGVTIIPHGILHYLPFAALTDGEKYFSDDYVLSTLPSASVLPSIQKNRKPDTTIESVLALGNPTFDEQLAEQEGLILSDLPFAKQEVETLTNLFGSKVEAHFGTDATESTLRQAGQANILHIAAHAIYDPDQPLSSKLILASDATNNGLLEVGEVYGLQLTNSTLVVLSACETGLRSLNREGGDSVITDGDEIVALNRAFLFAGTPTVLSTLWSVDDASTGFLMERFYTHLQAGMGKAEALRQAQIELREQNPQYAHPYFWAGFTLVGDMGHITPTPLPWLWIAGAMLMLLVVVGGGLWLWKIRKSKPTV